MKRSSKEILEDLVRYNNGLNPPVKQMILEDRSTEDIIDLRQGL